MVRSMNPMTYVASLVFPLGGSVGDKGESSEQQLQSPLPAALGSADGQADVIRLCSWE